MFYCRSRGIPETEARALLIEAFIGDAVDYGPDTEECMDWLRANAGRFGFRQLPSESWHWSTTGS